MKTFTKIIATIIATSTFTLATAGAVNAAEFEATDNYVTTNLCMAAAEGSKLDMNRAVKDSKLSKRFIVENVKCNNQDFIAFAQRHNDSAKGIEKVMGYDNNSSITITDMVAN